jgi:hypothetical protein
MRLSFLLFCSIFTFAEVCQPSGQYKYTGLTSEIKQVLQFDKSGKPIGKISGLVSLKDECSFTVSEFNFTPTPEQLRYFYFNVVFGMLLIRMMHRH